MPSTQGSDQLTTNNEMGKTPRPDVPRYFRFACHFWHDELVRQWPDQMKLFWAYLITNKHRTLEGFFVLPPQYIAADMMWSLGRVKKMLGKLEEAGCILFDPKTNLLLIRNALRYQQPESSNVLKGIISRVRSLPDNQSLLREFIESARRHCLRKGCHAQAQALPGLLESEFPVETGIGLPSNGSRLTVGTGARAALER